MATFNANILTPTRSNAASSDDKLPSLGALNASAMTSPTALAGTTGIDCTLAHGDMYEKIEGNLTQDILKNLATTVGLNETHIIHGNLLNVINGNLVNRVNKTTNDTRVGVHNQTNIAPRNDVFIHTRSETHHQPEQRDQKTEDFSITKTLLEFKEKHLEWKWLFFDLKNLSFGFCAPLSFEKNLLDVTGHIFSMEGEPTKVEMSDVKASLGALGSEIKAMKIKTAAAHLKAIAGNINNGIAANLDSPFG